MNFVTCYFYSVENPVRKSLKDEFIRNYPWVKVLEGKSSFFIDYKLVNEFLKENKESLTIIDNDCLLPDNFRSTILEKINSCDVLYNCGVMHEIKDGSLLYSIDPMTKTTEGFTGLSWSFSKSFLESINWTFPENFCVGGLDYVFGRHFIQKRPEEYFIKLLGHKFYKENFKNFYSLTKNAVCKNSGLEIIHNYHGPRHARLTDFDVYRKQNCPKTFINKRESCIC